MWMAKLQAFGMEVHAVGRVSVKRVAQNRAIHTVWMSGVDAELVGTSALGIVGHASAKMLLFIDEMGGATQYFVTGDSPLSVLEIDLL